MAEKEDALDFMQRRRAPFRSSFAFFALLPAAFAAYKDFMAIAILARVTAELLRSNFHANGKEMRARRAPSEP